MGNFINKIKQFFKNIISRNKTKRLDAPKNKNLIDSNYKLKSNQKENNQNEKNEIFEIYSKVKNGQYN